VLKKDKLLVQRKGKDFDVRSFILEMTVSEDEKTSILAETLITQSGTVKPSEIILLLENEGMPPCKWTIIKENIYRHVGNTNLEIWN